MLQAKGKPNILWLISEDTSPDLACYGNTLVKTPNLDKLAGQGAMYTNAFVTGPVCSASRSAIMTGMYQTSIGAHNHRSHRDDGYMLPHAVDDQCVCMGGFWTGTIDHACSAWIAQMMYTYYKYTGDAAFLKEICYPFMKGVMRVFEAMLESRKN